MSAALLLPAPPLPPGRQGRPPPPIPRDQMQSLAAAAEAAARRSSEQSHLLGFGLGEIRLLPGDPPTDAERGAACLQQPYLAASMRAAAVMFLAASMDYARRARIVLVTRANASVAEGLAALLRGLFPPPQARVELHSGEQVDALYARIAEDAPEGAPAGAPAPPKGRGRTYLVSLGTTRRNHAALVRHFRPRHALLGVESGGAQDYRFYDGELWIPPFGGPTKVLYLRAEIPPSQLGADPELQGRHWNAQEIATATEYFRYVTNENAAYLNPFTGTDAYLFGEYPNDYSHMFCLWAAALYLSKLEGPPPTEEQVRGVFRLLARKD